MSTTQKMVVRVLGLQGELLGWQEVSAHMKGDGCLWSDTPGPYLVDMDEAGTPHVISIHWADMNVEIRKDIDHRPVARGDRVVLTWTDPMVRVGPAAGGLPPVATKSSTQIGVPVGVLGARAM